MKVLGQTQCASANRELEPSYKKGLQHIAMDPGGGEPHPGKRKISLTTCIDCEDGHGMNFTFWECQRACFRQGARFPLLLVSGFGIITCYEKETSKKKYQSIDISKKYNRLRLLLGYTLSV